MDSKEIESDAPAPVHQEMAMICNDHSWRVALFEN